MLMINDSLNGQYVTDSQNSRRWILIISGWHCLKLSCNFYAFLFLMCWNWQVELFGQFHIRSRILKVSPALLWIQSFGHKNSQILADIKNCHLKKGKIMSLFIYSNNQFNPAKHSSWQSLSSLHLTICQLIFVQWKSIILLLVHLRTSTFGIRNFAVRNTSGIRVGPGGRSKLVGIPKISFLGLPEVGEKQCMEKEKDDERRKKK